MIRIVPAAGTETPSGSLVLSFKNGSGRVNERGDFIITATPPVEQIDASATVFPHIVDGGGYSTQFVLIHSTPGPVSSGRLQFIGQTGAALELSLR